jgi:uncharacterized membrane protein YphA (DoxX/SURF4 family)
MEICMIHVLSKNAFGALVLRLGLAVIFLHQGFEKITRAGTEWGAEWHYTGPPTSGPGIFAGPNPPPPRKHLPASIQLVVSWGEVIGGLALAVGVWTQWMAAGLIVLRLGAIGIFTFQERFSFPEGGGYESNFAILVMGVAVMFLGGGTLALDSLFRGNDSKRIFLA